MIFQQYKNDKSNLNIHNYNRDSSNNIFMDKIRNILQAIIFIPAMLIVLGLVYLGKGIKWIIFGVESEREKAGY